MAKEGNEVKPGYNIPEIYQGGYSSMKSPFESSNNYITAGSLSLTTDPRSANQLKEVAGKISTGVKNIDVTAVMPEVFDSIPKQQLKEINRLSKLTGVEISMHGPVSGMNVAGLTQQGYSETEREAVERKIVEALKRAKELRPDGNIPVVFHSAEGIPSSQLLPPSERKKAGTDYKRMIVVNRESGQMRALESEVEYHPGGEIKKIIRTPERRIDSLNNTEWKNSLFQVEVNRENAERIINDIHPVTLARFAQVQLNNLDPRGLSQEERSQFNKIRSAYEYLDQARQSADSLFSKAYELAEKNNDEKKMKLLQEASKEYGKVLGVRDSVPDPKKDPKGYSTYLEKVMNPRTQSEALLRLKENLDRAVPDTYVSLEKFATEKTAQTFGDAAFKTYKELKGKNVPIMAIENPPAGMGLSTGEDLRNVVIESRKRFVDNAVKEGMSKSRAEREAEKLIGATWDVGHINMLRGKGYSEKDIVEETAKIKDVLKHVHLSDNFGYEHTELPMGMGNVPLKEMMERLGEKGFEAKKIIEAGHWYQHMRTTPFQETLEGVGSPVYGMKMSPHWNQSEGLYQGYMSGFGQMLPQMNYETFGAGFSRLPQELGGTAPGGQGGRMSGRPME